MPIAFIMKVRGISTINLILDTPNKAKPISSGKGEAMTIAPKSGAIHFIKPR